MAASKRKNPIRRFVTSIMLVINLIACVVTIISAYGGKVDPNVWVLPSFAVMIFPVMALVTPAILIADLVVSRKLVWIPVATIALCSPTFMVYFPLNFTTDTTVATIPHDRKFSIATYNVAGFVNLTNNNDATRNSELSDNPAISWILRKSPDFVCLQEAGAGDLKDNRNINVEQRDSLERHYRNRRMTMSGISLLSKTPVKHVDTGIEPDESFVIECFTTTIDGRELTIVDIHFQSLGLSREDKDLYKDLTKGKPNKAEIKEFKTDVYSKLARAFRKRARQAEKVREFLDTIKGNLIVCGDFNDVPTCYAARQVGSDGMRDAYRDGAFGPTWTFNRERMLFRIDHVFYRGNLNALRTVTDRNRGSDHFPILTWFGWNETSN